MTNSQPERLPLTSADVMEEKQEKLKRCLGDAFPEVFSEGTIDFDQLKRVLGEWVEPGKERFGLNWPGKADCMKIIQQPSVGTLKPVPEESVNFDETENLFIEGDNLEVLKLLQKSYFGKIKMIYIDPPYNTGNDFIYPDKYAETLDTYLAYTGQIDAEGRKFSTNTDAVGRYHSRWLNMMYPRLYLARNLLFDGGVIFVSIDDNEASNLKKLMDEVFGEEAFIAQFVWKSRVSEDTRAKTGVSTDHEYILCYSKGENTALRGVEKDTNKFSNPDDDPRGPWRSADLTGLATRDRRPNLHYDLMNPETGINYGCPEKGWRYDKNTMQRKISEGRILWPPTAEGRPRHKLFLNEMASIYKNISSIITEFNTSDGTREVNRLLGDGVFDFPKPSSLIKKLISQICEPNSLVLDFFAGSAPLAQAVMELNSESGHDLRYVVVQLPEPTVADSPAHRAGYSNICEVARARIKSAALEISSNNQDSLQLDTNYQVDVGFKVLKLDRSNFKIWDGDVQKADNLSEQLSMHVDHIAEDSSAEDILYELLLKAGFPLTTKVEKREMAGKEVFSVQQGALLICLNKEITSELIDALAEAEPLQVICLDEGFKGNDQLKANAVQTFKARAQAEESEIVFRTV
jgi:adenine-specific DNA-methyltransferase